VVLADEAGMAGTLLLDQLVQLAAARGATVRLLGDDRQLPAVESGGALRLVASQPGTPELTVLHRFRDPAEAAATLQLRTGDGTAVDWYAAAGRIRGGSREEMTDAAYAGWKADMLAGRVTIMAAATNAAVTQLSARARADRIAAGHPVEPTGVGLHDGNIAGRGDWIVTRHNDRRLSVHGGRDWVKNADCWHVEQRHPDGSLTVRSMAHGGRARLPAGYVAEHVELMYATTTHRVQGGTVNTTHALITPGMTRENLYVLASRARDNTTLYVATHDLPFNEDDQVDRARTDPRAYAAREILLTIIATEGAPLSATETIATAQQEAGTLATLVPRYLHAAHANARHRYADAAIMALGGRPGADLQADPAWPAVVRRLYEAEASGWDPARLLTVVASQRELASADSIAEVLAWRIDGLLASHPAPPRGTDPHESGGDARERLAEVATTVLGHAAGRAQAELAWPALIAALRRAEDAGHDPAALLSSVIRSGEPGTARTTSEDLAWRVQRYLADHSNAEAQAASSGPGTPPRERLLPWLPSPLPPDGADPSTGPAQYLADAAGLIRSRVSNLADTAARSRPPWTALLGHPPDDPGTNSEWLRHVAIIAAYFTDRRIRITALTC
jgi:hypothetical protein